MYSHPTSAVLGHDMLLQLVLHITLRFAFSLSVALDILAVQIQSQSHAQYQSLVPSI